MGARRLINNSQPADRVNGLDYMVLNRTVIHASPKRVNEQIEKVYVTPSTSKTLLKLRTGWQQSLVSRR